MQRLLIAVLAGALCLFGTGAPAQEGGRQLPLETRPAPEATPAPAEPPGPVAESHPDPQETEAAARWARLQAEAGAERERRRTERERFEQGLRDAEAARQRYEADMARHREELESARAADEEYRRQRATYEAAVSGVGRASRGAPPVAGAAEEARTETRDERRARERDEREQARRARATNETCEERNRRNRRRGRLIGGIIGGVAGVLADREDNGAIPLLAVPAGVLIGEAIAQLLDCDEQERAVLATERAIEGGVGTTVAWSSETRPGVTGSSTVLATEPEAGGGECVTVTDIVIIEGEETRAPKRMCRRPPSNRFVRV